MDELWEDIMWEDKLHKRSYEQEYGDQLCIRIPRIIAGHAMSIREWGAHRKGMNFI